jgi:hypothetical protein
MLLEQGESFDAGVGGQRDHCGIWIERGGESVV